MRVCWTNLAADDLTHIRDYTLERFGNAQARRTALGIYSAAVAGYALLPWTISPTAGHAGTACPRFPLLGCLSRGERGS